MQFRHFSTFVFKHFSQTRNWVRVFVRNFCALVAGRYVSRGLLGRHALSPSLRFVTKILYEIMLLGFLCPTKPSKRAVHGAILLGICPFHNDFYFFIHRNPFFIFSQFYFYLFQTTLHLSCSKSHLHNLTNLCFAVPPRFL